MRICPLTVPVGSPGFLNSESHKTEIQVLAARAAVSPECRGPFLSAPVVGRTQFLAAVGLSPSASWGRLQSPAIRPSSNMVICFFKDHGEGVCCFEPLWALLPLNPHLKGLPDWVRPTRIISLSISSKSGNQGHLQSPFTVATQQHDLITGVKCLMLSSPGHPQGEGVIPSADTWGQESWGPS